MLQQAFRTSGLAASLSLRWHRFPSCKWHEKLSMLPQTLWTRGHAASLSFWCTAKLLNWSMIIFANYLIGENRQSEGGQKDAICQTLLHLSCARTKLKIVVQSTPALNQTKN
jgi:hypothetical protein